jgi:signal transduction histidine kinase/ActR/RegA family two-component response regulator
MDRNRWISAVRSALLISLLLLTISAIALQQHQHAIQPILISCLVAACLLFVISQPLLPIDLPNRLDHRTRSSIAALCQWINDLDQPAVIIDAQGRILFQNHQDVIAFGVNTRQRWPNRLANQRLASQILAQLRDNQPWVGSTEPQLTQQYRLFVHAIPITNSRGAGRLSLILQDFTSTLTLAHPSSTTAVPAGRIMSVAKVTHEIRTPLTSILGFTDVLIEELSQSQPSIQAIDAAATIKRHGQHLLSLVNDILEFSRLLSDRVKIEKQPCQIDEIVRDINDLFRSRFDEKKVSLSITIGRFLPTLIQTDPMRLRQILFNLVDNALKFTHTGIVRLSFELSATNRQLMVITVEDTGIGMTEATLQCLFQPFQQGSGIKQKFGGTGLGMSISRTLTRSLGGELLVESQPGVGSKFTATIDIGSIDGIPLVVHQTNNPATKDSHLSQLIDIVPKGLRILAAEDSADNQILLNFILRKTEAIITFVDNGHEAIQIHRRTSDSDQPFDLILMDLEMPIMNGLDATRAIREFDTRTPIIAFTAHASPSDAQLCAQAGCTDTIFKPIDRESFYRKLATHTKSTHQPIQNIELESVHAGIS